MISSCDHVVTEQKEGCQVGLLYSQALEVHSIFPAGRQKGKSKIQRTRTVAILFMFVCLKYFIIIFKFYLFIHERHTERSRDTSRGRSRLPVGSPTGELRTPGSQPEPLADAQPLSHPGVPLMPF